ncbi:MAG: TonB family protein [Deltaproteobacteria bacterium]|nr:TonB family protein [Deltaproteobacteria bacterium]
MKYLKTFIFILAVLFLWYINASNYQDESLNVRLPKSSPKRPARVTRPPPAAPLDSRRLPPAASSESLNSPASPPLWTPEPGGSPGGGGPDISRPQPDRTGSASPLSDSEKAYILQVAQTLKNSQRYPAAARRRREQGQVRVSFRIEKDGRIDSPRIMASSGYKSLDNEVLALMARVSPLPPLPPESSRPAMTVSVLLKFSLKK